MYRVTYGRSRLTARVGPLLREYHDTSGRKRSQCHTCIPHRYHIYTGPGECYIHSIIDMKVANIKL